MEATKRKLMTMGSVISGTMRVEDLIPEFIWEANQLVLTRSERAKIRAIERALEKNAEEYYASEESNYDLTEPIMIPSTPAFDWVRREWIYSDEGLYAWALSEGVRV